MENLLALDPGKNKFGWAFVALQGDLLASGIIPCLRLEELLDGLLNGDLRQLAPAIRERRGNAERLDPPGTILLGSGTARKILEIALVSRGRVFTIVEEAYTTLEARRLFWKLHPPGFFARWIPESLRVPPRPIDDLAAWALALRFLDVAPGKASGERSRAPTPPRTS